MAGDVDQAGRHPVGTLVGRRSSLLPGRSSLSRLPSTLPSWWPRREVRAAGPVGFRIMKTLTIDPDGLARVEPALCFQLSTFRDLCFSSPHVAAIVLGLLTAARGVRPMGRRFAVALVTVVLVGLAGCTSEAAAPGTPSGTSTASVPTAGRKTSGSPSTTSAAATTSSFVVPTPSVIDVPTPTSANPWPADLTPEQVVDAQAALATYRRYQEFVDRAGREPGKDWTADISAVTTAVAKQQLIDLFAQMAAKGLRTTGQVQIDPKVSSVEPANVVIDACLDGTNADFLDANGQVITAPDAPGTYRRHTGSAQVVKLDDGTWRVAIAVENGDVRC